VKDALAKIGVPFCRFFGLETIPCNPCNPWLNSAARILCAFVVNNGWACLEKMDINSGSFDVVYGCLVFEGHR
jgi:hypothetical protein